MGLTPVCAEAPNIESSILNIFFEYPGSRSSHGTLDNEEVMTMLARMLARAVSFRLELEVQVDTRVVSSESSSLLFQFPHTKSTHRYRIEYIENPNFSTQ